MIGLARLLSIFLFALLCWGPARASTLVLVYSERSAGYLDIAKVVTSELEKTGLPAQEVSEFTGSEWLSAQSGGVSSKLIVTLGADAFRQVLALEPKGPVLAARLPRGSYARILRESGRKQSPGTTALYLDQPFNRRLDLLKLVLPDAKRVGVLLGPESQALQSSLAQAALNRNLGIESSQVNNPAGLFSGLKTVLDGTDVLLAVADPQVYSSATIANILMATYRAGIPMIAFSPAYVKAGAMLAIYASPVQIGVQTANMARQILKTNTLPEPQNPAEFEISVNDHVARSLGLNLDAKSLTEKLHNLARRP